MQNLVVDGINVRILKGWMKKYFVKAIVSNKGTYSELETAEKNLEHGKGIYQSLECLGLITVKEKSEADTDISRIEDKLNTLRREKDAEMYARHMQRRGGNL